MQNDVMSVLEQFPQKTNCKLLIDSSFKHLQHSINWSQPVLLKNFMRSLYEVIFSCTLKTFVIKPEFYFIFVIACDFVQTKLSGWGITSKMYANILSTSLQFLLEKFLN